MGEIKPTNNQELENKLENNHKNLEINPIDGKFNEWLAINIDFLGELWKLADEVEKEEWHVVFVFNKPENFSHFLNEIKKRKLYENFTNNYVLLKWQNGNEIRTEIVSKDKAERFVETAPYYWSAKMYDKDYFENKKNLYPIDWEE